MQKKRRQLIDKIGQEQLPAGYVTVLKEIQQHGIGGDTGKEVP